MVHRIGDLRKVALNELAVAAVSVCGEQHRTGAMPLDSAVRLLDHRDAPIVRPLDVDEARGHEHGDAV